MSTITFHALAVTVHDKYGRDPVRSYLGDPPPPSEPPDRDTKIRIRVAPDTDTHLSCATGERLKDMEGSITLQPSDEQRPIASKDKSLKQIGVIEYLEAVNNEYVSLKSRYHIWVLIPRAQFNDLIPALRDSKIPPTIFVDAEGFKHPDEIGLEWDNKEKKYLPVVQISFSMPIAHYWLIDQDDKEVVQLQMPPTRADVKVATEAALQWLYKLDVKLIWALVGIAAIVIVLLWKGR